MSKGLNSSDQLKRSHSCIEAHPSHPKTCHSLLLYPGCHMHSQCVSLTSHCCCLHRLAKTSRCHRIISLLPPSTMFAFLYLSHESSFFWNAAQSCALTLYCCGQCVQVLSCESLVLFPGGQHKHRKHRDGILQPCSEGTCSTCQEDEGTADSMCVYLQTVYACIGNLLRYTESVWVCFHSHMQL